MEMTGSIIAGPYHPAFRSLVEESVFFDMAAEMLAAGQMSRQEVIFSLSPKDVSCFLGHKNKNMHTLKNIFGLTKIDVSVDPAQERGTLAMIAGGRKQNDRNVHLLMGLLAETAVTISWQQKD
jgi:hypothetical protein